MEHFEGMVLAMLCVWFYLRHKVLCFWWFLKQQRDLEYRNRLRKIRQRNDVKERLILKCLDNLDDETEENNIDLVS